MRRCIAVGAVLVLLGSAPGPARAEVKERDPAELLPPQTLAYLEMHQAGQVARELAALVKGSALEDLLAYFARVQAEHEEAESIPWNRLLGDEEIMLLMSPEVLAEAGRLRSGAIALTGFNKEHEPQLIYLMLTGDSQVPAFVLRTILLGDLQGRVREVARVEGVSLYQAYERVEKQEPGASEAHSERVGKGLVYAFTRGLVVFGSNKESLGEVVSRFHGKNAGPPLASRAGFKAACQLREQPGLFAYADLPALAGELDRHAGSVISGDDWKLLKLLINPQATRTLAAHLTLHKGEMALRIQVQLEPGQRSPLLDLLPDQAIRLDQLAGLPGDSMAALTFKLPDGAARWEKLVALIDVHALATGKPAELRPSLTIRQHEKDARLSVGQALDKIEAVTLAYHRHDKLDKDKEGTPLVILQARSEAAAKELEEMLPRLPELLGEARSKPEQVKALGVSLHSLPVEFFGEPLCHGRHGRSLVLALEPHSAAQALLCLANGKGLASEARVRGAAQQAQSAAVFGLLAPGSLLKPLLREMEECLPKEMPGAEAAVVEKQGQKSVTATPLSVRKQIKELMAAVEAMPPVTLSLVRQPEVLLLEVRPVSLQPIIAKGIDTFLASGVEEKTRAKPRPAAVPAAAPAPMRAAGR